MQATFLNPEPQPGEGAFLVQQRGKKHRRRKRGRKLKSFLEPSSDGVEDKMESETSDPSQGKHHPQTFLKTYDRQEPTSLVQPHDSAYPATIATKNLTSHDSYDNSFLVQTQALKSLLHPVEGFEIQALRFGQGYCSVQTPLQQTLEGSVNSQVPTARSFGQGCSSVPTSSQQAVDRSASSNTSQAYAFGQGLYSVPLTTRQSIECSAQLDTSQSNSFRQSYSSIPTASQRGFACSASSGIYQTNVFRNSHRSESIEDMAGDYRGKVVPPHLRKKAEKVQSQAEPFCSVSNDDNSLVPNAASYVDDDVNTPPKMRILKIVSPSSVPQDSPKDSVINSPDQKGSEEPIANATMPQEDFRKDSVINIPDQKSSERPLVNYPSSHEEDQFKHSVPDQGLEANSSKNESKRGKPSSNRGRGSRSFEAKSSTNESSRGKRTSRRGRGGRGGRQPREARWPKASEIRADPHRWDIKWESDEKDDKSATTVDSVCANAGYGGDKKQKKQVEDGIDPETGFMLTDWDGKMAPAPLNWDARPAFRDGQSAQKIERWRDKIEEAMLGMPKAVPMEDVIQNGITYEFAPDPKNRDLQVQGDPAPRYWIPVVFGHATDQTKGQAPQSFWNELTNSKEPEPCDADDLVGAEPWWQQYHITGGHFLKPYAAPDITGIDPDETKHETDARENDHGSAGQTRKRKDQEKAKRDAKLQERQERKDAKADARKLAKASRAETRANEIKPKLKLSIRSANTDDAPNICKLYNHYIDNSVCTPETERRVDKDIHKILSKTRSNKVPFIVACEPGAVIPARKKKKNPDAEPIILPDKIIGFAFARPYSEAQGIYRFTAEVQFFTDKEYYMKGVAKCLLDKMLGLLDPDYVEKRGYQVIGEELDGSGAMKRVKGLVVELPYDGGDTRRLEWMVPWLDKGLGFEKVGDLPGVGVKAGKSVNLAIFLRKTGEVIEPHLCK